MEKVMKILSIVNRKGGASKSTLAAHLAIEATNEGLKTILIDMDPQKTLESWWERREEEYPAMVDIPSSELSEKLERLEENGFDLCIIDTPGDTTGNAEAGIKAAQTVLIPCKPTPPDLAAVGTTISQVRDKHQKPFFFVITQAPSSSQAHIQAASVLSEFGPVAPDSMMIRKGYSDVMGTGQSATEVNKAAKIEIPAIWSYVKEKLGLNNKTKKLKVAI